MNQLDWVANLQRLQRIAEQASEEQHGMKSIIDETYAIQEQVEAVLHALYRARQKQSPSEVDSIYLNISKLVEVQNKIMCLRMEIEKHTPGYTE